MAEPDPTKASRVPQYGAALAATLGGFALGTCLGWSSPVAEELEDHVGGDAKGWIGSVLALGGASVFFPLSYLLDRFGRKMIMLVLVPPFFLGWAVIIAASEIANKDAATVAYVLGRFITGFCGAAFCVAAPIFIGEVTQPEHRGTLGIFFQLMLVLGILYSYTIGAFAKILYLSIACGVVPIIFGVVFLFIPESPYFLAKRSRQEAAAKALQWFRGKHYDITTEMSVMTADEDVGEKKSFWVNMKRKDVRKALIIGVGLMLCQQLCGINAVIFNAQDIFKMSESDMEPNTSAIVLGVVQLVSCFVAALVVSKAGGKLLMIISMSSMGVCHLVIGVFFILRESNKESVEAVNWLPLLMLCLFLVAFSIGAGPIPWAMIGELFPSEVKGIAASICGFVNWILAFLVSFSFPYIRDGIGNSAPFFIFCGLCVVGVFFVIFVCLETKGKTLEEIQVLLGG